MSPVFAADLLLVAAVYLLLGGLCSPSLLARGLVRLDPTFAGASFGVRVIALPATLFLWPLLLARWLAGRSGPPEERNAHRLAAAPAKAHREPARRDR